LVGLESHVGVSACMELNNEGEAEGVFFTNLNAKHKHISLVDAALATSAAPTFFPRHSFSLNGKMSNFVDGGVV